MTKILVPLFVSLGYGLIMFLATLAFGESVASHLFISMIFIFLFGVFAFLKIEIFEDFIDSVFDFSGFIIDFFKSFIKRRRSSLVLRDFAETDETVSDCVAKSSPKRSRIRGFRHIAGPIFGFSLYFRDEREEEFYGSVASHNRKKVQKGF